MEGKKAISKPFKPIPLEVEAIGKKVLDSAYAVHSNLGPGLLESVYEVCLAHELRKVGVHVETQVPLPVQYQSVRIETGLRLDLWADRLVVVELKSVETMPALFEAQLLTYLK
ncbi:MAG TPA: GxxExxY protein, partial [Anaerolineales bacterium]